VTHNLYLNHDFLSSHGAGRAARLFACGVVVSMLSLFER